MGSEWIVDSRDSKFLWLPQPRGSNHNLFSLIHQVIPKSFIQNINDFSPQGMFNETDTGFLFTVEGSLIVQSAEQYADFQTAVSPLNFSYFHPHVHVVVSRLPHLSNRSLP